MAGFIIVVCGVAAIVLLRDRPRPAAWGLVVFGLVLEYAALADEVQAEQDRYADF